MCWKKAQQMGVCEQKRGWCRFLAVHIISCAAASFVFHQAVHTYFPAEAAGADISVYLWPLELIFVPLRIALAVAGTIFSGLGPIEIGQPPFFYLTVTYLGVTALLLLLIKIFCKP